MSSWRWRGWRAGIYDYGYFACECCDECGPRGREGLEEVLASLSRRGRRESGAVVGMLDARVLAAAYGAGPDRPGWWDQRM